MGKDFGMRIGIVGPGNVGLLTVGFAKPDST